MGLYVSIVLLAMIVAFGGRHEVQHELAAILGTAIGLGLADLYAFRLSARLFHGGTLSREDAWSALGLSLAVVAVGLIASLPYLLLDEADEPARVSGFLLVALIFIFGFMTARASGGSSARALVFATASTIVGLGVVLLKAWLTGH